MKKAAAEFDVVIQLPLADCCLALSFDGDCLSAVEFVAADTPLRAPATTLQQQLVSQIEAYFRDPSQAFEFESCPSGTEFQRRVWQALRQIPSGSTVTYGALAKRLDSSARAVGNACRNNPIPLLVPCHRVVAAHGIGGFMGQRQGEEVSIKQALLQHEQQARRG